MKETVLVLGANGRIGRSAVEAFLNAGWAVRAFVRHGSADRLREGVRIFEGDAFDVDSVASAAEGADVIVNALNPPYERWAAELPRITHSVLLAARRSGATVMIPGNVYNYGESMPPILVEDTPHAPTTRKGTMREEMEGAYRSASAHGVQTIVLRAGDYFERNKTGNWFDSYIANKVGKGVVTYPGSLDRMHAWAFLPDVARALVELAEARADLPNFDTFGFEGFSLTGRELVDAIESAAGRPLRVKRVPWPIIRLLGFFSAPMREVLEMKYLWEVPHRIDGGKLARTIPQFRPTEMSVAIADACDTNDQSEAGARGEDPARLQSAGAKARDERQIPTEPAW